MSLSLDVSIDLFSTEKFELVLSFCALAGTREIASATLIPIRHITATAAISAREREWFCWKSGELILFFWRRSGSNIYTYTPLHALQYE